MVDVYIESPLDRIVNVHWASPGPIVVAEVLDGFAWLFSLDPPDPDNGVVGDEVLTSYGGYETGVTIPLADYNVTVPLATTANLHAGTPIINGIADTTLLRIDTSYPISGSGIPSGTTMQYNGGGAGTLSTNALADIVGSAVEIQIKIWEFFIQADNVPLSGGATGSVTTAAYYVELAHGDASYIVSPNLRYQAVTGDDAARAADINARYAEFVAAGEPGASLYRYYRATEPGDTSNIYNGVNLGAFPFSIWQVLSRFAQDSSVYLINMASTRLVNINQLVYSENYYGSTTAFLPGWTGGTKLTAYSPDTAFSLAVDVTNTGVFGDAYSLRVVAKSSEIDFGDGVAGRRRAAMDGNGSTDGAPARGYDRDRAVQRERDYDLMVDLTFRSLGAWGAGKGANLVPSEVDNNFWNLAQAIFDLQNDPATPNGIASITVSGTQMTITLHDGTVMGPFELPLLTFRWRGEWQPFTAYAELDVFTVVNTGIYLVQIAHTTGSTFDANLLIPPTTGLPAYLMLFGSTDASLSALPDVALTALTDEDFLTWDTTTGKWVNVALGGMAYQEPDAVAITGGGITGLPVPVNPTDAATKAYVDAGPAGSTAADGTMMSNIAGTTAAAIPNTLSAYLDHVLATTVRGALLYRGGSGWLALLPGTSGLYLRTAGSGADPAWAAAPGGVTSITAGTGISTGGAAITSTGTVSLAAVADSAMLGNAAGASAAPVPLTLTQFLDHALTSSRGTLLVRNVTGWNALAPGTTGTFLKSLGAGADLAWDSPLGAGTVTSVAAGTGLTAVPGPITAAGTISFAQVANGTLLANISGSTAAPVPSTLSLIFDSILSSTQGAVLYRGASAWSALAPGTSGQFLQTGGAAANPSWASSSGAAPIAASNLLSNLTAGTAVALGHTLSDTLDYIVSSSRGTLLYRGASSWAGLAPGSAGQVLTTGGTTADPSWATGSGAQVGTGNLIARRVFTASATYTPTTGTGWVLVTVVPGGGAGGGVAVTSATQQAEGSGGGSAGVVQRAILTGFSGAAIVVGAGGTAASGAVGGNGGTSSFGSVTAGGGTGGALGTATANASVSGGAGGTASGGDLNIPGERGWLSSGLLNGGAAASGRGGSTPLGFGSGGEEQTGSAAGVAGIGYGSGGSGAINAASQSARAGGNGAPGVVIVDEYGMAGSTPAATVSSVAAAGTDQATATALTTAQNYVSGATGINGVRVDTALMAGGQQIVVANEHASNALLVYPPSGATINAQAANTPLTVYANSTGLFAVKSSTALRSVP